MKHSEFKRRIGELGFEVADWSEYLTITDEYGGLAWVSKEQVSLMGNSASDMLSPEVRTNLLEIMFDYARTPIEDREDEKKYLIYPIKTLHYNLIRYDNTFRRYGYESEASFDIDGYDFYNKDTTCAFDEDEAKEICDFFGWDFDKVAIEVEDE